MDKEQGWFLVAMSTGGLRSRQSTLLPLRGRLPRAPHVPLPLPGVQCSPSRSLGGGQGPHLQDRASQSIPPGAVWGGKRWASSLEEGPIVSAWVFVRNDGCLRVASETSYSRSLGFVRPRSWGRGRAQRTTRFPPGDR